MRRRHTAPIELEDVGCKLVMGCRGLPLALIVLGGILLRKDHNRAEWRTLLDWAYSTSDVQKCLNVLALSYDDLPHRHLKSCFLYLAVYQFFYSNPPKFYSKVIQSMWPGICGNPGGSRAVVSKMRKLAIQVSRFMLQMVQTPKLSDEYGEEQSSENSPENLDNFAQSLSDLDSSEEGLAIRIAVEVANFPEKKTAAGKSFITALCRIVLSAHFRPVEQNAVKCMRGLLNFIIISAACLKYLDEHPDEEFSEHRANAIFDLGQNLK